MNSKNKQMVHSKCMLISKRKIVYRSIRCIDIVTGLCVMARNRCNEINQRVVFTKMKDTVISDKIVLDFNIIEICDELKTYKANL